jgi:hypothetical protein
MGTRAPSEAITIGTSVALLVEENWATPTMQREPTQQPDPLIDPRIQATQEYPSPNQVPESH